MNFSVLQTASVACLDIFIRLQTSQFEEEDALFTLCLLRSGLFANVIQSGIRSLVFSPSSSSFASLPLQT